MLLFTLFLLAFHCRLINKNMSTNEYLKGRAGQRNYSFSEPLWPARVWRSISCRRRHPSMITNDIIRLSLLLEQLMDFESI